MSFTKHITITLKNGHVCEHDPLWESEDEEWAQARKVVLAPTASGSHLEFIEFKT
jgi:hypothetical protein